MQLAQVNIARMKGTIDSPVMADFVANLDRINTLAENSPGFVWRLKDDGNNATSMKIYDDDYIIVNMSVWTDIDSLFRYVYHSDHVEIFKRKKEWFHKMQEMHMAMWYIEDDLYPSVSDARERLEHIREHGETPYAFTFKNRFSPAPSSSAPLGDRA
ncbi:DUF3291 domain-containing protein [Sinomicrobium weinanense]|uniref:DUF3291 domain-containing protein n=1 Tax=Sinomicrobium weinanense TaxID=2842200 RepID=A0A926JUA1_9FLAO|nr:DUF3291 domain-containing protein [Sinomicrobium weinanense]MBC9797444.1 DUF3291 domain-containing protein [Sinomicrobium weinanense]MBU3125462.1 DUF3291 domain-containing protein [Sinomicrobium weinanense]